MFFVFQNQKIKDIEEGGGSRRWPRSAVPVQKIEDLMGMRFEKGSEKIPKALFLQLYKIATRGPISVGAMEPLIAYQTWDKVRNGIGVADFRDAIKNIEKSEEEPARDKLQFLLRLEETQIFSKRPDYDKIHRLSIVS